MTGSLSKLFEHKEDEQAFPFVLNVGDRDINIMASARGNSRKKRCHFPPIKLEFGLSTDDDSIFSGQKSLKLVTHCNKSKFSEDNLIEEFIAYRFFNLLSDASYRVRLVNINYIDTEGNRSTKKPAFIIESNRELATRNHGKLADLAAVSLNQLNEAQLALVFVFQYLIANTDWSLVAASDKDNCCHNGKLINTGNDLLYVPYDFDLSGLVDANYAFPDPSFHIKKVTQRMYRGFCLDRPVIASALNEVKSLETSYLDLVESMTGLSRSSKKKANRFLGRFFNEASDEQAMLNAFEQRCLD